MMIFSKARLALLSVPKTGTTAYQTALRSHADLVITDPPALKHAPVYRFDRFIRPMYEKTCGLELELMAVMREPVDWLGSWYRYRQRAALDGRPNSTKGISFDDFVAEHLTGNPAPFAHVGRQSKFLEPRPNGTSVSHLFRYEDQPAIKAFLHDRLGVSFELARENASPVVSLTLSAEIADKLRRKHAQDFDLYNSIAR